MLFFFVLSFSITMKNDFPYGLNIFLIAVVADDIETQNVNPFMNACEKSGDIWKSLVVIKVSWRSFSSYTTFPLASYSIVVIFVIRNMSSQGGTISIFFHFLTILWESFDIVSYLFLFISKTHQTFIVCSILFLAVNTFITLEQLINYNIFLSIADPQSAVVTHIASCLLLFLFFISFMLTSPLIIKKQHNKIQRDSFIQ